MGPNLRSESLQPARDRTRHHIADIAHHFLDEAVVDPASAGTPGHVVVHSSGDGRMAASVCAALAAAPGSGLVTLVEPSGITWSANCRLIAHGLRPIKVSNFPAGHVGGQALDACSWQVASSAHKGPVGEYSRIPGFDLHNWGGYDLEHFRKWAASPCRADCSASGKREVDVLVWVVEGNVRRSMSEWYHLGLLLEAHSPRQLEIVCSGSPCGGPPALPEINSPPIMKHGYRRGVKAVASNLPLYFTDFVCSPDFIADRFVRKFLALGPPGFLARVSNSN